MSLGTTIFFNTKTASFWACEEISICGHVCHENKHTIISCFKVTETEKQTSHKFVSNPNVISQNQAKFQTDYGVKELYL